MKIKRGKKLLSGLLICSLLITMLWIPAWGEEPAAPGDEPQTQDVCEQMLSSMTTEEKISMMIMPDFRYVVNEDGKTVARKEITSEVKNILKKRGFAGVILFAENTQTTENACWQIHDLQTANASAPNRTQLLIAIDQEGGKVTRLGEGTQTPGNMALGATGDPDAAETIAKLIGSELASMGINYNAAPVVDVNNNPANPVIGVRSFSDDPQMVSTYGVRFMKGLQSVGIISTLKHFPGHGDTATDSHTGLPCVDKSYEQLKQTELVPFQACIDAGAEAVMTAHIQYPQVDPTTVVSKKTGEPITVPATLSKKIMTDILRGDIGFRGVIITDAMGMAAIDEHFGKLDAARLAINAGVDIILMPTTTKTPAEVQQLDEYITDVAKMADNGQISMDNVNASVLRILRLKEKHGLLEPYDGSGIEARVQKALQTVGSKAHHDIEWDITKKAITLLKNDGNVLPLTKADQKIVVLTPYADLNQGLEYAVERARDEGQLAKGVSVSVKSVQGSTAADMTKSAKELIKDADHVVLVTETILSKDIDPAKTPYSATADAVIRDVHSRGKTVTLLSVRLPYDAARYQAADAIVLAWSSKPMNEDPRQQETGMKEYGPNMPAALYMMLTGEKPQGKIPVNIPTVNGQYQYTSQILYARGYGITWPGPKDYCPDGLACPLYAFYDTDPSQWYHDGVHWALKNGIMKGTWETAFAPDESTTRAMIVTMLWRMKGEPAATTPSNFDDVEAGSWYEGAVNWAAENKIVTGYDDKTFGPSDPVSREQLATILFRYSGAQSEGGAMGLAGYVDEGQINGWAREAMLWAVTSGIINGITTTTLEPQSPASRAQVATMLMRFNTKMSS